MNNTLENNNLKIANEIRKQIMHLDFWALAGWGATDVSEHYRAVENGLAFKISTPRYQRGAWVKVVLNAMDTYNIEVLRIIGTEKKILGNLDDIYAEQLVEVIDSLIENKK
ncbi:hypothetical protein [Priestia megaterium]|uniref:Uncharacterized protein n=1 Tax=Priestia megaterium TaxID=1404 RepID=A0A6M6DZB0_PRIMG|nr:hypothetical protein [Priestia megaterium]QJX80231.1 hypothetical protein FDZ14_29480 [Priestia megaterium]